MKVLHVFSWDLKAPANAPTLIAQGMIDSLRNAGVDISLFNPVCKYYCTPQMLTNLSRQLSRFDLMHLHEIWRIPEVMAAYVARHKRVPYVVTPYGELIQTSLRFHHRRKQLHRLLFRDSLVRNASALHAFSDGEAHAIRQYEGNRPILTVPFGLDVKEFLPLPPPEVFLRHYPQLKGRRLVLFLGRVHPLKGLEVLGDAFARLRQVIPDAALVIAGPSEAGYLRALQEKYRAAKIFEHVTFTGLLTGNDRSAAFSAASIFVLPSRGESLSRAVLEAMACHLPVVVTEECHIAEIAEADAGRVVPNSPERLAAAMIEILNVEETRIRIGENARRLIERRYCWDLISRQLINMYQIACHQ